MTHVPVVLEYLKSRDGYGLKALPIASSLVVFVHGFLGDPRGTWTHFESLIQEDPDLNETDICFYAYRSRHQVPVLAGDFLDFLLNTLTVGLSVPEKVRMPSGNPNLFRTPARNPSRDEPYENVILVGHSTGALVIREAVRQNMITSINETKGAKPVDPWQRAIVNSQLRFFAPAHVGVMSSGKLGLARSLPIISRFTNAYFLSNPLYQNLVPTSPTIKSLQEETEKLWDKYYLPCFRAISLFGEKEEIVFIGKYAHDEENLREDGHHHTSICKPTPKFLKPLEFVKHGKPGTKTARP